MQVTTAARFVLGYAALLTAGCGAPEGANAAGAQDTAPLSPAAAVPAEREAQVRAFVNDLFGAYAPGGSGLDWREAQAVFDPELAGAIGAAIAKAEAQQTIPDALGADPLCGCQDWADFDHRILDVSVDGDVAKVGTRNTNFGGSTTRDLELVDTPQGWRVYDIDGSFRQSVMEDA